MLLSCSTILNLFFHLHKTFILEATEQGIPETTIYCTMKSNTQEVYSKRRFDWVTVIDGGTNERVVCTHDIPPNTHFIAFDGIIRTMDDFKVRRDQGKGSYAVGIHGNKVLDCYNKCLTDRCLASKANNSKTLIHSTTREKATKNARITVGHNGMVTLKSLDKVIQANTEIMHSYGSRYKEKDYI